MVLKLWPVTKILAEFLFGVTWGPVLIKRKNGICESIIQQHKNEKLPNNVTRQALDALNLAFRCCWLGRQIMARWNKILKHTYVNDKISVGLILVDD